MQYFIYLLVLVWTLLFGFIFFRLFPDATDRLYRNKIEQTQPCDQPLHQQEKLAKLKQEQQKVDDDETKAADDDTQPVPLGKGETLDLKIQNSDTLTIPENLQKDLDKKLGSALENRLIRILVKMNVAACPTCTSDDRRIVLQLKMMKAFLDGRPKDAMKYSEQLDTHLKTKKIQDLKKKSKKSKDDDIPMPRPLPKESKKTDDDTEIEIIK